MTSRPNLQKRAWLPFLFENSFFLIAGSSVALVWANAHNESYASFADHAVFGGPAPSAREPELERGSEGSGAAAHSAHGGGSGGRRRFDVRLHHSVSFKTVVNDLLMALFFAIAAKEVWAAMLPGGPLANVRRAATPLLAASGGMVGPAAVYITGCLLSSTWDTLGRGWAIPTATDIAFSYLVARLVFGPRHVAIPFLLLLAIADDAAGLVILAFFYPQHELAPEWLLVTALAVLVGFGLRRFRRHSFWWYLLIPGALSWFSLYQAGVHPALGLVPIIPAMPHAHTDLGIFARRELSRHDTLTEFEHFWKNPVEVILGLFGLANAGVQLASAGTGTYLVLAGLLVGKPLGITLFGWLGEKTLRLELPAGMSYRDLASVGMLAGIGFTVALFVAGAAFNEPGPVQDSVKMGALASFLAAVLAYAGARALGIRRQVSRSTADEHAPSGAVD